MRVILLILGALGLTGAVFALSSCGGSDGNSSSTTTTSSTTTSTSAPVATATPPAGKSWLDVVEATGEGWARQGNPNAPIKLIEYGSRSCPVCGAFAATGVEPLREKYVKTGQVSYEFRDFPVHPQDVGLSTLGRCVPTQAFFVVLDQMYAQQQQLNDENKVQEVYGKLQGMSGLDAAAGWVYGMGFDQFLMQRGVSADQIKQCLTQPRLDTFSKQIQEGVTKGVSGTPTFFVNDKQVEGPRWVDLEPALKAAGAH